MAHDLLHPRRPTAKNFAIQGHPPIYSHEYVMAGGGYARSQTRYSSKSGADPAEVDPARDWLLLCKFAEARGAGHNDLD